MERGLYSRYVIEGLNLDRMVNSLAKSGIKLYKIKKKSQKSLTLSIEMRDNEKFFAFFKEMCYNENRIYDRREASIDKSAEIQPKVGNESFRPPNKVRGSDRSRNFSSYNENNNFYDRREASIDKSAEFLAKVGNESFRPPNKVRGSDASRHFSSSNENNINASRHFSSYNITKIKDYGIFYPIYFLKKRVGILIGLIIFIGVVFCGNNLILGIDYSGTGTEYAYEAKNILDSYGIKEFAFIKGDLSKIADQILAESGHFTFASLKKHGTRIKVELIKSVSVAEGLDTSKKEILATKSGIIESLKVYRGTAKVKVGDYVTEGAPLVIGLVNIKDHEYITYALADISIITEFTYNFITDKDDMESVAEIFAKENLGNFTITEVNTTKTIDTKGFNYTVKINYRIKI